MSVAKKGTALITGSAQGIGRAIALRLARNGFDISLNDLPSKVDQLQDVANEIDALGRRTCIVPADVSLEKDVEIMVQETTKALGGLDVMVANAGVGPLSEFLTTGVDEWERVMAINARGTFLCYKYAAAQMIAQGRGGRIIGASSVAGRRGLHLGPHYCASKFAIRGLTQSVALDLGPHNITVNAYAPGVIRTPMAEAAFAPGGPIETLDQNSIQSVLGILNSKPIKGEGTPEDVAGIVSFLASGEARFITGKFLLMEGWPCPKVSYGESLAKVWLGIDPLT